MLFMRQNLFKSILFIAKSLSLQSPSIFCMRVFYNNVDHLSNIREISPKHIEDICRLNNVIIENIPKKISNVIITMATANSSTFREIFYTLFYSSAVVMYIENIYLTSVLKL